MYNAVNGEAIAITHLPSLISYNFNLQILCKHKMYLAGSKVGQMTRIISVSLWSHFGRSVGLMHILNYLDATQILIDCMFIRNRHWCYKLVKFGSGEMCLTIIGMKPAYYLKLF